MPPATKAAKSRTRKTQGKRHENHCGYCHAVYVQKKRDIKETLNSYGTDYLAAGRGIEAVKTLAGKDSDGDGFSNDSEFVKGTNPGEPASNPSAPIAPYQNLYLPGNQKIVSRCERNCFPEYIA